MKDSLHQAKAGAAILQLAMTTRPPSRAADFNAVAWREHSMELIHPERRVRKLGRHLEVVTRSSEVAVAAAVAEMASQTHGGKLRPIHEAQAQHGADRRPGADLQAAAARLMHSFTTDSVRRRVSRY